MIVNMQNNKPYKSPKKSLRQKKNPKKKANIVYQQINFGTQNGKSQKNNQYQYFDNLPLFFYIFFFIKMGTKESSLSAIQPADLIANSLGFPMQILKINPQQVIAYLITKTVPRQDAESISKDIGMKSLQQVSRIMALIPVLQQVGAVIAVIAGLLDLINTKHEKSFNSIVSGIVGQSFITDHYSYISANLKAISYNIGIQKYDQACQLVESTYFQVNERVQNDELKKWYTSMSNKKSLQLLVLYYKANVQIVQIFDQVLKKRKPQQRQKYQTIMTDYLACLNQLKADFLKYRGSLMSIQLQHDSNPVARLLMSAIISDKGQDKTLQIKLKDKDKNHYNDLFIGFKDKSLKKAQEDINTIIVL